MLNIVNYLSERELFKVLDKYNVSEIATHGKKVSSCALRLFDSLNTFCDVKSEERNLLHYSAILHDIGYFINKKNHHQHTKYIILKEPLLYNIPTNLRGSLAFIASGHGKSIDDSLNLYSANERITLLKLTSILRIADALDHKHHLQVSLEKVEMENGILNILIKGESSNIIIKRCKHKSSLFSKIYNIPIYMECS